MTTRTTTRLLATTAIAALAAGGAAAGASAASAGPKPAPQQVAAGLNNPRQLSFAPNGDLYVAEAGTGGSGPCVDSAEGEVCFGLSGSVTRVRRGVATRVLTRLPSLAHAGGASAQGPTDITVKRDGRFSLVMGLGNDPAVREQLPPAGKRLATVLMGRLGGSYGIAADLGAYEVRVNPHKLEVDTNPAAIETVDGSNLIVDAGGNDMLRQNGNWVGNPTVFHNRMVDKPPFMPPPGKMPMQSVPTGIAVGPDGAFYVSELTGFPFPVGEARIYRVVPGKSTTVYASGLTNVTGIAFSGRTLYAVQFASAGLLNVPPGELPTGSLVRVRPGQPTHPVVAEGLPAPYGVAIRAGAAYVTTCAVCPAGGGVSKIPLS